LCGWTLLSDKKRGPAQPVWWKTFVRQNP
jgi:hypothetical protein